MRVLSINFIATNIKGLNLVFGNMLNNSPFEFDALIINTFSTSKIAGSDSEKAIEYIFDKYRNYLEKWLKRGNPLIVITHPFYPIKGNADNYSWLPFNLGAPDLTMVGKGSQFLGKIDEGNFILKNFLTENSFNINTYLTNTGSKYVAPLASVEPDIFTAFYEKTYPNVLFIPQPVDNQTVLQLLLNLQKPNSPLRTVAIEEKAAEILDIDNQISELTEKRKKSMKQLNELEAEIIQLVDTDIYLSKASQLYEKVTSSLTPDPRDYYEAVEKIERSFGGEHKMRKELGLTQKFTTEITRRANEFRHAKVKNQDPIPLSDIEIKDFNQRLKIIIMKFLENLIRTNKTQ